MAKKQKDKYVLEIPFTAINYILFFVALIVIAVGFYFQSIGPANSFESRTLAPIVLVFGYLFVMPAAIMYRQKKKEDFS